MYNAEDVADIKLPPPLFLEVHGIIFHNSIFINSVHRMMMMMMVWPIRCISLMKRMKM